MAYQRYQRYYGRKSYFKRNTTAKPTAKMASYIKRVVSASTGFTVKYPRSDPGNFKTDRPFKRMVRMIPGETIEVISPNSIALTEAGYYGHNIPRWRNVKILSATFYGAEDVTSIGVEMTSTSDTQTNAARWTDHGDKNHRPCIKILSPALNAAWPTTSASTLYKFDAGSMDCIDVYCEFN